MGGGGGPTAHTAPVARDRHWGTTYYYCLAPWVQKRCTLYQYTHLVAWACPVWLSKHNNNLPAGHTSHAVAPNAGAKVPRGHVARTPPTQNSPDRHWLVPDLRVALVAGPSGVEYHPTGTVRARDAPGGQYRVGPPHGTALGTVPPGVGQVHPPSHGPLQPASVAPVALPNLPGAHRVGVTAPAGQ